MKIITYTNILPTIICHDSPTYLLFYRNKYMQEVYIILEKWPNL